MLSRTKIALWHDWYAWRPVKLNDGRWAWLEVVSRRKDKFGAEYHKH